MKNILEAVITTYVLIFLLNMLVGISMANFNYVGACHKSPTTIGYYTGLSTAYDVGCYLGKERVNENIITRTN